MNEKYQFEYNQLDYLRYDEGRNSCLVMMKAFQDENIDDLWVLGNTFLKKHSPLILDTVTSRIGLGNPIVVAPKNDIVNTTSNDLNSTDQSNNSNSTSEVD